MLYHGVSFDLSTLDNASQDVIQVYVFIHAMWLCAIYDNNLQLLHVTLEYGFASQPGQTAIKVPTTYRSLMISKGLQRA